MIKKLLFSAVVAVTALTSCDGVSPKSNLKTDIDTMSYEWGLAQSQDVKLYLANRVGVDTTYLNEILKGVTDGAKAGDDKKKAAYFAGVQIGQQLGPQMLRGINYELFGEDSTQSISLEHMLAGFIAGTRGKGMLMSQEEAVQDAQKRMEQIKAKHMEKSFGEHKKKNEDFLVENAKKEGVQTLPSGVQYKVIKEGNGAIAADTSKVLCHYEGRLIDGTVFDSSYKNNNNRPVEFVANQTIKGWTDALTHMPAGSTWEVYIPQELAYGTRELGPIKPFSTLIFKLELVSVNGK